MAGEEPAPEVTLDGTVERFVFKDEESSFTVARFGTTGARAR